MAQKSMNGKKRKNENLKGIPLGEKDAKILESGDALKEDQLTSGADKDPLFNNLKEAEEKLKVFLNEMSEKANELDEKIRHKISHTEEIAKRELKEAENKIRENPLLAVGIAAGFGVLIGLLLNRNK